MTEMIRLGGKTMFKKLINKKNTINNYNEELDSSNIPEHIAIMDGNGRWASEKCLELKVITYANNKKIRV